MKQQKSVLIISMIWIMLITLSFVWSYISAIREKENIALQASRSLFDMVVLTRAWNSKHGGVYVAVTPDTSPNPYLNIPMRDIKINHQLTLTKINPAYMTRQISEIAKSREGIQFHITSLKPIRPENKATELETLYLNKFEEGLTETGQFIKKADKTAFFYMAPLQTRVSCMVCHAKHGYELNDIRGGISVTLPMTDEIAALDHILSHLGICLVGLWGIIFFGNKLQIAYKTIHMQASVDMLTGLSNRRSFDLAYTREFKQNRRIKSSVLSLIMCDIDHFKYFNDHYGHAAGDACLVDVARTIKESLKRPGDFCARYGGEEFIIILPNTNQEGARYIAELLRSNVEKLSSNNHLYPDQKVTISLGVACVLGNEVISQNELLHHADMAMYQAKTGGRNQVQVFDKTQLKVVEEDKI